MPLTWYLSCCLFKTQCSLAIPPLIHSVSKHGWCWGGCLFEAAQYSTSGSCLHYILFTIPTFPSSVCIVFYLSPVLFWCAIGSDLDTNYNFVHWWENMYHWDNLYRDTSIIINKLTFHNYFEWFRSIYFSMSIPVCVHITLRNYELYMCHSMPSSVWYWSSMSTQCFNLHSHSYFHFYNHLWWGACKPRSWYMYLLYIYCTCVVIILACTVCRWRFTLKIWPASLPFCFLQGLTFYRKSRYFNTGWGKSQVLVATL